MMDEPMKIMQGDSYNIAITLTDDDGEEITSADEVSVTLGKLTKTVTYSEGDAAWLFPLSQDETFALDFLCGMEVRVKTGTNVVGASLGNVYVIPSTSTEVL